MIYLGSCALSTTKYASPGRVFMKCLFPDTLREPLACSGAARRTCFYRGCSLCDSPRSSDKGHSIHLDCRTSKYTPRNKSRRILECSGPELVTFAIITILQGPHQHRPATAIS